MNDGRECCCMCGDVGLYEHLFLCISCHRRFQHMYCSQGYPCNLPKQICNWCILRRDRYKDRDRAPPTPTPCLPGDVGNGSGVRPKTTKQGSSNSSDIDPISLSSDSKQKKEKERQREGGRCKQQCGIKIEGGNTSSGIIKKAKAKAVAWSSTEIESSMQMQMEMERGNQKSDNIEKKKNDDSKRAVRRYKYLLDV